MDPVSIAVLVTTGLTFILNIFQSVQSNHFHSACGAGCCSMDHDFTMQQQHATTLTPAANSGVGSTTSMVSKG